MRVKRLPITSLPVGEVSYHTRNDFYAGITTTHTPDYRLMSEANVLAVEMECPALFIVGTLRGVKAAVVLAVDGSALSKGEEMSSCAPSQRNVADAIDAEISIALHALASFDSLAQANSGER